MAKLSRTQKYAELRSQIANDSAQNMNTPQLNPYADRLNQMQEQANPSANQFNSFSQTPVQPQNNNNYANYDSFYNDNFNQPNVEQAQSFDSIVSSLENNQPNVSSFFADLNTQESQFVQPEQTYEQPQQDQYVQTEPVFEQPQEAEFVQPEPIFEQPKQDQYVQPEPIFEQPQESQFVQPEVVQEQPQETQYVQPEPVFEQPQVMPFEEAELAEEPYPENKPNEFVNNVIDEVNTHNQNNGVQTIESLTNEIAHDAVHSEEFEMDDEFSNTVTMEINKIMDQMYNTVNNQVIPEATVEAKPLEEKQPADFVNAYFENSKDAQQSMIEATSNIKKSNTQEIEIMSLDELQKQDEISDTIPFVVNNNAVEEEEYYDEDDDDASNTVLNVILIVLILVLVAVLGLIVFYILKTKNIIG